MGIKRRRPYKVRRVIRRKKYPRTLPGGKSHLEEKLALDIRALRLPVPVREYKFAAAIGRKFAYDFAWVEQKIAVECEGGIYLRSGGRHTRGEGFEKDCEKYNLGVSMGWVIGRFTPAQIRDGDAIEWIENMLAVAEKVKW